MRAGLAEIAHWAKREARQQPLPGRGKAGEQESQGGRAAVWLCRREGLTVTPQTVDLASPQFP